MVNGCILALIGKQSNRICFHFDIFKPLFWIVVNLRFSIVVVIIWVCTLQCLSFFCFLFFFKKYLYMFYFIQTCKISVFHLLSIFLILFYFAAQLKNVA